MLHNIRGPITLKNGTNGIHRGMAKPMVQPPLIPSVSSSSCSMMVCASQPSYSLILEFKQISYWSLKLNSMNLANLLLLNMPFLWLACIYFIPRLHSYYLWTTYHRESMLSKKLMNEIWYDERNLASLCKVLGNFIFQKFKNSKSIAWLLDDAKFLQKPYDDPIENLTHMLLDFALSLVKLFVTFLRNISYSHNQYHVHSTHICRLLHLSCSKTFYPSISFHEIKAPRYVLVSLSIFCYKRDIGYQKKGREK
jgi:hypothetical protein